MRPLRPLHWRGVGVRATLCTVNQMMSEIRLASFPESATRVSGVESRIGFARLTDEQAALRRVATLVARGTSPEEVFAAVTDEVVRILPVELATMCRYETDGTITLMAVAGRKETNPQVGNRLMLGGRNISTVVAQTERSARIDDYSAASGPIGVDFRAFGVRSAVGAPIVVEGGLWGVMVVGSGQDDDRMPADTGERLGQFTELLAMAVANAESRAGLAQLAEEQAALRRVATLVARGMPSADLFAAVAREVGQLLPVDFALMGRYEADGAVSCTAAWGAPVAGFPIGRRWDVGGRNVASIVCETGRAARIDGYADRSSGPVGEIGRQSGIHSAVGTPILVEGHLWGTMVVGSTEVEQPLPRDTEARLASFTELVATAIANAESRAALAASRARIVAAADESRRRIERDLHDGAQQHLVHAVITLKLALEALSDDGANASELVADALCHAEQAKFELRELAHGILPAALTRGGLKAGIDTLISRVSLPVTVDVTVARFPAGVEATAYFVISEALTNAVKHASASRAHVTARLDDGQLHVEVCDDGAGGAHAGHGSGLGGLEDRVAALDGRLTLDSPPGHGTRLRAFLPVA